MALAFPNRSRSYDDVRHRVRFVGHDGMIEVPFFVETDALVPAAGGEAGFRRSAQRSTTSLARSTEAPAGRYTS